MTVTIHLSTEAEARLREKADERGLKLEDFLSDLATRWATYEIGEASNELEAKTAEQRVADWRTFVASHDHITAIADDSRESIYEGCRE